MDLPQIYLVGHIAVFGAWFGTDIATFVLSRRVIDPGLDLEARRGLAGAMTSVEVIARLCLPAMLALGLSLAIDGGYLSAARASIAAVWALAAAWIALVWMVHRGSGGAELSGRLAMVDLVVRSIVCLGLWTAGVWSWVSGDGPFVGDWLAAKVVLFALIMSCGILIRFQLRPFAAAFGDLMAHGSSPEREAALSSSIRRAQPIVGVIWLSLLAATALGATQSLPWQ
jgi:hypothetical protein